VTDCTQEFTHLEQPATDEKVLTTFENWTVSTLEK
jgi:hypothetical protein